MTDRPVNALVVGWVPKSAWCGLHDDYVPESQIVVMHGGRGRLPTSTCLDCMERSLRAWAATECPFCVLTAERMQGVIDEYRKTGKPISLPAVPSEELPAHKPGCLWEYDVLDGMPTS